MEPVIDNLPDFDTQDTDPAVNPYECQNCGNMVDRLITVEDRDDSVGYRGEVEVCQNCIDYRGKGR